jgi:hypothetical protein
MVLCNIMAFSYMKTRQLKQVQSLNGKKSYIPNEALVNFIQDWLHYHKKKDVLTKEGKELTKEDRAKLDELRRMKPYVLDNVIFPAMANLTYFFEALAVSKKLTEAFDDDVIELLDPSRAADAAKFSGNDMRMSSIRFRNNNLARLVMSMVSIHYDSSNPKKRLTDFRVGILYQLLNIVGDAMDDLLSTEFSFNQVWRSAYEDYTRMKGWLALLAISVEPPPKEYDRVIGFTPIWYSSKADLASYSL